MLSLPHAVWLSYSEWRGRFAVSREPVLDATTARLEGDFLQKTGWGVAALYAIDADSNETTHPGWHKGIWIGSTHSAQPSAFVPDDSAGEGVVVDSSGNLYGAVNAPPHGITRYAKR